MTSQPGDTRAGSGSGIGRGQPSGGLHVAGITVRLSRGAYLLSALIVLAGAVILPATVPGWPPLAYLAATAGLVAGALASLIAHELAHALAARRHGAPAQRITIGFFGGAWHGGTDFTTARALWRVAAAGPAASLALAVVWLAVRSGLAWLGAGQLPVLVFTVLMWANLVLTAVSALPGGVGLDGGRIVLAGAWARSGNRTRATVTAARIGQYTGALLTVGGVVLLALGYLGGAWVGLTGLVMAGASRAQAQQALAVTALADLTVRDILPPSSPAVAVPGWQTVQFLYAEFADGRAAAQAAVVPAAAGAASASARAASGTAGAEPGTAEGPDVSAGGRPDVSTGGRPDVSTGGRPDVSTAGGPDVDTAGRSRWSATTWAFPVRDFNGRAAGLLTLGQLAAVPADHRANLRITDIATPIFDVVTARIDEPLARLVPRLAVPPASPAAVHTAGHALVVDDDGAPVGVLTPADFARARQLGALFARPPLS